MATAARPTDGPFLSCITVAASIDQATMERLMADGVVGSSIHLDRNGGFEIVDDG